MRAINIDLGNRFIASRNHEIAAQQKIRITCRNPHRMNRLLADTNSHMTDHRTKLLGKAGLIHGGAAFALQVCRHGDNGCNRQYSCTPYTGNDDIPGSGINRSNRRFGQRRYLEHRARFFFLQFTRDSNEAGAEALQAAVILIAGTLVYLTLTTQFSFQRQHRQAVGRNPTVSTAFADFGVNHHPHLGIHQFAFFTPPALLGSTGLLVDQDRGTRYIPQLSFNGEQVIPVINRQPGNAFDMGVTTRVIRNQRDPVYTLTSQLHDHLLNGECTVHRLATRHGYRIVVENLVGNVDAGRNCLADRQQPGMKVGTITQVLKHMLCVRKGRLAYPGHTFSTHLGKGFGLAVANFHHAHVVAADATQCP